MKTVNLGQELLESFKVETSEVKVAIINYLIALGNQVVLRKQLIEDLVNIGFDKKEVTNALQSLNELEIILWKIKKNLAWVEFTVAGRIALEKIRYVKPLADEVKKRKGEIDEFFVNFGEEMKGYTKNTKEFLSEKKNQGKEFLSKKFAGLAIPKLKMKSKKNHSDADSAQV